MKSLDSPLSRIRRVLNVPSKYSTDKRYDEVFVFGYDVVTIAAFKQCYRLLRANNPSLPLIFVGGEKDWLADSYAWRKFALSLRSHFNERAKLARRHLKKETGSERMQRIALEIGASKNFIHSTSGSDFLPDIVRQMSVINCCGKALVVIPQRWAMIFRLTAEYMLKNSEKFEMEPFDFDLFVVNDEARLCNFMTLYHGCLFTKHFSDLARLIEQLDGKYLSSTFTDDERRDFSAIKKCKKRVGFGFYRELFWTAEFLGQSERHVCNDYVFD